MKGLALWQPWATAMALGVKRIETRHWPTSYRGLLLITATKRFDSDCQAMLHDPEICEPLANGRHGALNVEATYAKFRLPGDRGTFHLPLGCALCIVDLVDCVRTETVVDQISDTERAFGNYEPGRWAWITRGLRRLPLPRPGKGAQGLWKIAAADAAGLFEESTVACIHCGCTDDAACPVGCHWVTDNECSHCVTKRGQ